MLLCPICSLPLTEEEKTARCDNGHCFDRASQGYWNLLRNSSSRGHGDDKEMLLARRRFLEKGYYRPLMEKIAALVVEYFPDGGALCDAGCGEGYYTAAVKEAMQTADKKGRIFAFDIAKDAARMTAVRLGKEHCTFVASAFGIPLPDQKTDLILSLFSPFAFEEYCRILKNGGVLIRACCEKEHLFSLKEALYETALKNETKATIAAPFHIEQEIRIRYPICLESKEDIRDLFGMTPYSHKTAREDLAKLERLSCLETEADFGIQVIRKTI